MSIRVFRCEHCGTYMQHNATVDVTVKARLDIERQIFWLLDRPDPLGAAAFQDIVQAHCPECNRSMKLLTLEECPRHMWRSHRQDRSRRICMLCGEEQEGRVVFDDE